ncbi:MAG: UDP-N-acetylglucosamine 2-epimerase (non-hydrolyzing) [Proteobacteria bacterium]|nr:UDP-N-acetylglucosamine 2-epimerase (non-hydrolyzing) [Pseudomonadota bacterium]
MNAENDIPGRCCVLCVVGARPNFMKIMPLMRAFAARAPELNVKLVHTGQHYDVEMNSQFFNQLGIPTPDVSLEVGSGTHAVQTAEIMKRFEPVVDEHAPDAVLVVGDVNSTIACSLVAAKKGVRVVHVEAGLRSRDRSMPEEINRILTDQLSDRLYITEDEAIGNLIAEGIRGDKIVHAGNVMIDTLLACRSDAAPATETLGQALGEAASKWLEGGYGLLTLHRPSNVDDAETLQRLLATIARLSERLPLVFPMHPRTQARIEEYGLGGIIGPSRVAVLGPQGYLEMLGLLDGTRLVLTDSGGLQEESTALGVPCLTLRENTERPVTIREGTNVLVGTDTAAIEAAFEGALSRGRSAERRPRNWDGRAAERIVDDLAAWLKQ